MMMMMTVFHDKATQSDNDGDDDGNDDKGDKDDKDDNDDENDESCWNSRGWGDNANKCDALNKSSADRRVMMMTIMTIAITKQILVNKLIKEPDNEKKNEFLLNGDINELPKFDKIFHLHNFLLH